MANPTTNYGFVLPTPTNLVTDLPADFDVALQGVDTRLKALQPGTTAGDLAYSSATANTNVRLGIGTAGQVLAVVSGVPAWTTTADVTPLTTKGDLFTFSTVDARLAVGTNGQVLTADSAEATGLKFATPAVASGGLTFINKQTFSASSAVNINNVFDATYKFYKIVWSLASSNTQELQFRLRVSGTDTTTGYNISQIRTTGSTTSGASQETNIGYIPASFGSGTIRTGHMVVYDPFEAVSTKMNYQHYSEDASSGVCGSRQSGSTSFTGCTFLVNSGTITGEILIYGFNRS